MHHEIVHATQSTIHAPLVRIPMSCRDPDQGHRSFPTRLRPLHHAHSAHSFRPISLSVLTTLTYGFCPCLLPGPGGLSPPSSGTHSSCVSSFRLYPLPWETPEMSETARLVREVPRTRWEDPLCKAVCSRRSRTSVCIVVGTAVAVGNDDMYACRA